MSIVEVLSAEHEDQLKKYLRFFRGKRDVQLQEVAATIRDQREMLLEDMYTRDDVVRILDSLGDATRATVMTDLQATVNMSVLVLRQLFEEAEAQEIELELDLAVVEDEVMLKEVEKISMDAPTRERKKKAVKLDSMRDEHQRLMLENERLRSELKGTRSRADELEGKCSEVASERQALQADLQAARTELTSARSAGGGSAVAEPGKTDDEGKDDPSSLQALRDQLAEANAMLNAKGVDMEAARDAALLKVTQSSQFKTLRAMVHRKNEQLEDVRRRLLKYEPDQTQAHSDHDMK